MSSEAGKASCGFSNAVWCCVVCLLVFAGCEVQPSQTVDTLKTGPDLNAIGTVSEEAGGAIAAAGGLDAWSKIVKIDLECVATFYQEDGTFYLTEQLYEVYPWSNSVRISGREPGGEYSWQMQNGRFGVLEGLSEYQGLSVDVDNGCIAEGVLSLVTAPARLLDKDVEFKWSGEPVKLGGQWYRPGKRVVSGGETGAASVRDAAFYQRRSTERVDMVLLGCWSSRGVLIVRGHDYRLLGRESVMIPSKIEVFNADSAGRVRHRVLELNVK